MVVNIAGLVRARWLARATIVACLVAASLPVAARAGSGAKPQFSQLVSSARIVVLAAVVEAPPRDAAYRLTVEQVLKGPVAATLEFPADPKAVTLVPGTRVVLLIMDPHSLDFRGTTVLTVTSAGGINSDGVAGAPATVVDLLAAFGLPPASVPPTSTSDRGGPPRNAPVMALLAAVVAIVLGIGTLVLRPRH